LVINKTKVVKVPEE